MRRIYVKNNTVMTKVIMTNANDEIIFADEFRTNARLMDDDMIVDRKTIAKLCNMTEEEFTRNFSLSHTESQRVFGEWALMDATFEERNEPLINEPEDIEEELDTTEESEETVGDVIFPFMIDLACIAIGVGTPMTYMYNTPVSELNEEDVDLIFNLRHLMALENLTGEHKDLLCDEIAELDKLIDIINRPRL